MAKSKRKQALEARNKKEASKLLKTVIIGTVILMILMFLLYRGMSS